MRVVDDSEQQATLLDRPVFIVGAPRSGTGLLRSILASHPNLVSTQNETAYLARLLRRYGLGILPVAEAIALVTSHKKFPCSLISSEKVHAEFADEVQLPSKDFVQRLMACALCDSGQARLLMKDPKGVTLLDEIAHVFPKVQFVHIVRDPRGVMSSHKKRWPNDSFTGVIDAWKRAVSDCEMWEQRAPQRMLQMRFEDLTVDFQATIRKLCSYLELPPSEALHSFSQPAAYKGTKQGVDSEINMKWKKQLTPAETLLIEKRCSAEMDRWEYFSSGPQCSLWSVLGLHAREGFIRARCAVRSVRCHLQSQFTTSGQQPR